MPNKHAVSCNWNTRVTKEGRTPNFFLRLSTVKDLLPCPLCQDIKGSGTDQAKQKDLFASIQRIHFSNIAPHHKDEILHAILVYLHQAFFKHRPLKIKKLEKNIKSSSGRHFPSVKKHSKTPILTKFSIETEKF